MKKYLLLLFCVLCSVGASAQVSGNGPRKASANGHEYVDLGLPSGTLWATCNIGASSPEEYGNYYAWGETTTKSTYNFSTYKYCNGSEYTLTKYCTSSRYGTVDNKTELEFLDDAAYVNWGGNWRMPSLTQFSELINSSYTTTSWITQNGVKGRKITSKSNGNSIFLPAAGYRSGTSLENAGGGDYWSRTLYTTIPSCARLLGFYSGDIGTDVTNGFRCRGKVVRPVGQLATSISLNRTTLSLTSGSSTLLNAIVNPSNALAPVWSCSDPSVAQVSSTGRVVAVSPGTCTVTCAATDGSGVKATCKVTVTAAAATVHEYVDLGLPSGTLWATTNVGAASPEDYGHYFAWGETATKASYNNWATYSLCNGSGATLTKYCSVSTYGTVDNLSELEASDDAATALWGADWLMPTREQMEELVNSAYTTTEWTTQNGVPGRLVTSLANGNSLFLPAAGGIGASLVNTDVQGYYWSRTNAADAPYNAYYLRLRSSLADVIRSPRYWGLAVRPVHAPLPEGTAYAVWCAANRTLYFTSRLDELAAGDTFTPEDGSAAQTVTAVWSGTDVTQSGSSMPQWWMTVYPTLTTAVVEPSFAEVRPASTAYWFFFCAGLTTLDLRNLNTSATTDMQGMFMNCTGLTTVLVDERWTTAAVTSGTNMFQNCTSIVGGNGTAYDASHIDHAYACIDTPTTPGYLTGVVPNVATLTDGETYTLASDADYDRVDYVRTFTTTGWQALYVPFALSYADWAGDFEVARLNDIHQWDDDRDGEIDRTALEVILLTGGETVPHTPYLIRAKTVGEKTLTPTVPTLYAAEERSTDCSSFTTLFTVTGTYSGLSGAEMLANGYYALGGGQLVQAASAESALKPMRWYVSVTDRDGNPKSLGEVKVMVFGEDGGEVTSIGSVSREGITAPESTAVFDLSGRRVAKPRKGIYVRGGRKYIVK